MSIRKTEHVRLALGRLNTRGCKVGAIAILFVLMATATAAVFSMDYVSGNATARSSDVYLATGSDICGEYSSKPSQYPAAVATISDTKDYAQVGISMFPSVTQTNAPQPATYYTDVLKVVNDGNVAHQIKQIVISDVSDKNNTLGEISIYCWQGTVPDTTTGLTTLLSTPGTTHVDISGNGASATITPSTGVLIADKEISQSGQAGNVYHIGIVAHAAAGAGTTASNAGHVSFSISIQWA